MRFAHLVGRYSSQTHSGYHVLHTLIHILIFFVVYLLLQVEQIQAEYKVLALQFHPDKNNGDKDAEAKFQSLKVFFCYFLTTCLLYDISY